MCKCFELKPLAKDEMSLEEFLFFLALAAIFVQWSGTIAAIVDFRSTQFSLVSIQKSSCCYRINFGSRRPKVCEEMSMTDF